MLRNLDVLRAMAILCVVVSHLLRHVLGIEDVSIANVEELGRFGVLVFFVHTSVVLLMSLDRQPPRRAILHFYVRRLFRIYPLSIAAIALVLLFRVPFMPNYSYTAMDMSGVLQNLLLVQNVTGVSSVIGPLWSLPYEVQMYLALPFLHTILQHGSSTKLLVIWIVAIAARLMPLAVGWNLTVLHFVPCFLGGALAYRARQSQRAIIPGYVWPVCLMSMLGVYISVRVTGQAPFLDYLLCLMLGTALVYCEEMRSSRFTEFCEVLAKYSYGIYLSHAPVMWFSFYGAAADLDPLLQWATFFVLSVAVPWAAYWLIEEPMIRFGRRLAATVSQPEYAPLRATASA